MRRKYFVPLPSTPSILEWNAELLQMCDLDNLREHYKKERPICELFEADRKELLSLPRLPFEACRYEHLKTNGYGKFVLDGKHTYSSSPMYAEQEIVMRVGAHFIEPLDEAGDPISRHNRQFGSERTDTVDWLTILDSLIAKPGAWKNSVMRSQMSYDVRDYMDDLICGRHLWKSSTALRLSVVRATSRNPYDSHRIIPATLSNAKGSSSTIMTSIRMPSFLYGSLNHFTI